MKRTAVFVFALSSLTGVGSAIAGQYIREGYGVVYGFVGGTGGAYCCATAGALAGGYAGEQFGYRLYDNTAQSIHNLQSAPPPYYPVYPEYQYGVSGSTPMMVRRRY